MVYTGFFRRLVAISIDGFILMLPSLFLGSSINSIPSSVGFNFLLGFIYYPIFESSALCATPGKALLGIMVLGENGQRLSFKAAAVRYFCRYISMATFYIGYLMQVFSQKRQTLHDLLSESVVVDQASPDLNYFTVWKDQFKYIVGRF